MENILNRKIAIENDANCFTVAEAVEGAAKGYCLVFGAAWIGK